jgi:hypothetical protein
MNYPSISLSKRAADALLDGRSFDAAPKELVTVLQAAGGGALSLTSAGPNESELVGEPAALFHFRAAALAASSNSHRQGPIRDGARRFITIKILTITTVALGAGEAVSYAAGQGVLPAPVHRVAEAVIRLVDPSSKPSPPASPGPTPGTVRPSGGFGSPGASPSQHASAAMVAPPAESSGRAPAGAPGNSSRNGVTSTTTGSPQAGNLASSSASNPGNKPTSNPGNRPTSNPGNRPTSNPGNKPTSSPGNKPTAEPGKP